MKKEGGKRLSRANKSLKSRNNTSLGWPRSRSGRVAGINQPRFMRPADNDASKNSRELNESRTKDAETQRLQREGNGAVWKSAEGPQQQQIVIN